MLEEWKAELWNIEDVKPAEYNPRKRLVPDDPEYQKLKESLLRFGTVEPLVINKDGTIIGGHQRYNVLKDLGEKKVPVSVVDLNKQDEKALNVALNKIDGEWDNEKLRDLLIELDHSGYDIEIIGYDRQELDDLIELTDVEPTISDDGFNEEAALSESRDGIPTVRLGEVWELGRHKLMCGDSTKIEDVKKLMGAELMDLFITDPPYNVNYEEKAEALNHYRKNKNGHMPIENDLFKKKDDFHGFLLSAFKNMEVYMRDGAAAYVFHADIEGLNFRQAFCDAGLKLAEVLIWEKNHFVLGRQDYQWRHEPILYGWKEGKGHYFIKDRTQDTVILEDDIDLEGMKKPELIEYIKSIKEAYADQTTVLYENKPVSSSMHPTMKPLELVGKLMRNSSKKGWNVGDLFGGSGSTLIAAEQLGRNAYLMEMDEHYASVIIKRWEDYTGETARRVEV